MYKIVSLKNNPYKTIDKSIYGYVVGFSLINSTDLKTFQINGLKNYFEIEIPLILTIPHYQNY